MLILPTSTITSMAAGAATAVLQVRRTLFPWVSAQLESLTLSRPLLVTFSVGPRLTFIDPVSPPLLPTLLHLQPYVWPHARWNTFWRPG